MIVQLSIIPMIAAAGFATIIAGHAAQPGSGSPYCVSTTTALTCR